MLWMETGSVSFVLVERETAVEIQTVRDGEMEMEMEIQMVQDGEMVSFEVSRGRGPGGTVYIPPVWTGNVLISNPSTIMDPVTSCSSV